MNIIRPNDYFLREMYSSVVKVDSSGFCEFPAPGDTKKQLLNVLVDPELNLPTYSATANISDKTEVVNEKEYWMPDRLCKVCYSCEDPFTMYRRRHHCRMCGQIFCNPCSSYYIDGSWLSLSGPVRACKFCSEQITDRIEKETKNRRRGSFQMAAGNNLFLEEKPKIRSAVVSEPFLPSTISNSKANNSETDQIKLQYTDILQQKASNHLEKIVEKMLMVVDADVRDAWKTIIVNLVREVVSTVDPNVRQGDSMNIREYVKIKIIPGGGMDENTYVDGIIFRKNVPHKSMSSRGNISNPRVLLFSGGIEFQRSKAKFSSLDTLIEQENKYLELLVEKILILKPDIIIVGASIARRAQEILSENNVVALQNVKSRQLTRIARLLGATILPSTDYMIQQNGDECLGSCKSFSIKMIKNDPERAEKVPSFGGILKSRACRGSAYVYLEGCPSELGCSIVLRGATRSLLWEIKRILKFGISVAYHLRLEVAYYNDRHALIPLEIKDSKYEDLSDTEEWVYTEESKDDHDNSILPTYDRFFLSTSLDIDYYYPYRSPIHGITLNEPRDYPRPKSLAIDYNGISGTSIVIGEKVQKNTAETQSFFFYGDSDISLGKFLMERCFHNSKNKEKESLVGQTLIYAHRLGRIEIEVMLIDGDHSNMLLSEEDELQSNSLNLPIYTSSYCRLCENWVTPYEPISEETWKISLGKFYEIALYNKTATCRTGECTHVIRDHHQLSFFCETNVGRFQARMQYQPLHLYALNIRKTLPFDNKFHMYETAKFLKNFMNESNTILGDFTRILSVLEKEVSETLSVSEETYPLAISDINAIQQEISSTQTEIEQLIENALSEIFEPTAESDIASIKSTLNPMELKFPMTFCKYLLSKAIEWNHLIDDWHRYLSTYKGQNNRITVQPIVSIKHLDAEKPKVVPPNSEGIAESSVSERVSTTEKIVTLDEETATEYSEEQPFESNVHGANIKGSISLNSHIHIAAKRERRFSTTYRPGYRIARAFAIVGIISKELLGAKFSVPLDDLMKGRFSLKAGKEGEVIAVSEDDIASIISYSMASEEYYEKFTNEIGDDEDQIDSGAAIRQESNIFESRLDRGLSVAFDDEISPLDNTTSTYIKNINPNLSIIDEHDELKSQMPSPITDASAAPSPQSQATIAGIAKVVPKADDLASRANIEERDTPIPIHIQTILQKLKSSRKLHIKHRFEDKDEDDNLSCKFICHTFWATQFQALRSIFLDEDTDEGFIRSLAQSASWNAQGGKSGASFSKSQDGRFVVKCISKTELQMFLDIALEYFKYLADAYVYKKPTVLCKILGIYQVGYHNKISGKKVMEQVVVMENVFHNRNITRVFDLKGSSRARYTPTEATEDFDSLLLKRREARASKLSLPRRNNSQQVLMDDNLMELTKGQPFPLKFLANNYLQKAIENDTDYLLNVNIVDYSILVGVDEDNFEIVVGIIDYMRQYDIIKRVERMGKSVGMIAGQAEPTIIQPSQYKRRFRIAMERNFMGVPDKYDF